MYPELTYREVRPADRERVREISAGVWEGTDYLPSTFEEWVQDPGASFQAAEEDGLVVGLQRLRPIATKLMFYEGLRVAATGSERRKPSNETMQGQPTDPLFHGRHDTPFNRIAVR